MAGDALDAFLELTPNGSPGGKMRNTIAGETQDVKKKRGEDVPAAMEITQFSLANTRTLAAREQREQLTKALDQQVKASSDGKPITIDLGPLEKEDCLRSGRAEEDYRFQVRKLIDQASPYLMQAYFSNSYKGLRPEFNDFKKAKVTFRKTDSRGPKTFLTILFTNVYVVGFRLETDGTAPPEETVEFCFQTCEMIYRPQEATGALGEKNIKGWDFQAQKEYASGATDEPAATSA